VAAVARTPALTCDQQRLWRRDQAYFARIDAGKLDEDDQARRVIDAVDVNLRAIAAAEAPREGKDLPEVGKELLDLLGSVLEVASFVHRLRVPRSSGLRRQRIAAQITIPITIRIGIQA
jgi:hypothetical protein